MLLFWVIYLRKDFFSSTHYPIRFNRKTRQVHVFRDQRDGGVLTVPWEKGYFHIGRGIRDKFLRDLRCHVLDGEIVKDTFAVGHYFDRDQLIQELWEFIRRYMDEGPQAARVPFIQLSVAPTWKNCWIHMAASAGAGSLFKRIVLSPLLVLLAGTRWLVFRTCKTPRWSAEIEAECAIEPDDPYLMKQPAYIGEGYNNDTRALEARMRKAQAERRAKKRP